MQPIVIFSAPSGSGKTTIVRRLLSQMDTLTFAVSATTRRQREGEEDGRDYYFLPPEEFKRRVAEGEFVEWEEVYHNTFYGTLRSELERLWADGRQPLFDLDVQGGLTLKKKFGEQALLVFIMPPSLEVLRSRLEARGSEPPDIIEERVAKARLEMTFAPKFDVTIINEDLQAAVADARCAIEGFLGKK